MNGNIDNVFTKCILLLEVYHHFKIHFERKIKFYETKSLAFSCLFSFIVDYIHIYMYVKCIDKSKNKFLVGFFNVLFKEILRRIY